MIDRLLLLVEHLEGHRGRTAEGVALDVGEQRIAAVADRAAGVEHQVDRIGPVPPPRRLVHQNRRAGRAVAQLGCGIHARGVALRGRARVADGDGHLVVAGHQAHDLLEEDTLVGALGLLEGCNPNQLFARQIHRPCALAGERETHPIAGHEGVALALEGEGPVLQREPEDRHHGIPGPSREGHAADERHRIARGEPPEPLVELLGVEQRGERLGGTRLRLGADPLPVAASQCGDHDRRENQPTHQCELPRGEVSPRSARWAKVSPGRGAASSSQLAARCEIN